MPIPYRLSKLFRDWQPRRRMPANIDGLIDRLQRADAPESHYRPIVEVQLRAAAIDPEARLAVEPDGVAESVKERIVALLNSYSKRSRQKRYRRRVERGWLGLRIVSEGDSWFQYPVMVDDIIDHLLPRYAIYSLGEGGDTLETICHERSDEIFPALVDCRPHCFLLSGGGNDMVKDGGLAALVHDYRPGDSPEAHLHPNLDDFIAGLRRRFTMLFDEIHRDWPGLPIIFHGYDRPIPQDDIWLGRPLASRGIADPAMQRAVIARLMDRYNEAMAAFARGLREPGDRPIYHVDCRGAVPERHWRDAMHPNDLGFASPAARIDGQIRQLVHAGVIDRNR